MAKLTKKEMIWQAMRNAQRDVESSTELLSKLTVEDGRFTPAMEMLREALVKRQRAEADWAASKK